MGFRMIDKDGVHFKHEESKRMFQERYEDSEYLEDIVEMFTEYPTTIYHCVKPSAIKEVN
jgi:hypothetical protein